MHLRHSRSLYHIKHTASAPASKTDLRSPKDVVKLAGDMSRPQPNEFGAMSDDQMEVTVKACKSSDRARDSLWLCCWECRALNLLTSVFDYTVYTHSLKRWEVSCLPASGCHGCLD